MIIKCPECETSFLVPAESLAPEGRKVRCSNCQTEWFQKYQTGEEQKGEGKKAKDSETVHEFEDHDAGDRLEEGAEEQQGEETETFSAGQDKLVDIPEALIPNTQEDEDEDQDGSMRSGFLGSVSPRATSYVASGLITFILLAGFSLSAPLVTSVWPSSVFYYKAIGMEYPLAGENLEFDNLQARAVLNKDTVVGLEIEGEIVNLSSFKRTAPPLEMRLLKQNKDESVDHWLSPGIAGIKMESGQSYRLDLLWPGELSAGAKYVQMSFLPDPRLRGSNSLKAEPLPSGEVSDENSPKTAPKGD